MSNPTTRGQIASPSRQSAIATGFEDAVATLYSIIIEGFCLGKSPFLVLGAGVSDGIVPYLHQMAGWLIEQLENDTNLKKTEPNVDRLISQGRRIMANAASRNDAAEFFSTLQDTGVGSPFTQIWERFYISLVRGPFMVGEKSFKGLHQLKASDSSICHQAIAGLLSVNSCHVLNLNFDPLLYRAFEWLRLDPEKREGFTSIPRGNMPEFNLIALHHPKDIVRYFSSPDRKFQPAVANARGDVFYVRCFNRNCPEYDVERPLPIDADPDHPFQCAACHLEKLRLELSFPSYQSKELVIQPMLAELQEYIGVQTSIIVVIGLSGKWDPYLLAALFHWAGIYGLPIIDVKPICEGNFDNIPDLFLEEFRTRYFPGTSSGVRKGKAGYIRYPSTADEFMKWLYPLAEKCVGPLPDLPGLRGFSQPRLMKE